MTSLLSLNYWFALLPPALSAGGLFVLGSVFGAFIVAAIVLKLVSKRKRDSLPWKKGGAKFAKLFGWMGVLGFVYLGLAYEQVRFFGSRFWLLVWAAVFLLWLWHCVKYVMAVAPEEAAAYAEKARIEKYLPKRK